MFIGKKKCRQPLNLELQITGLRLQKTTQHISVKTEKRRESEGKSSPGAKKKGGTQWRTALVAILRYVQSQSLR